MSNRTPRKVNPDGRMALTLKPDVYEAYMKLSEVSGIAATSFASQMLTEAMPIVHQLIDVFQLMKEGSERSADEMDAIISSLMIKTSQASLDYGRHVRPKLRKTPRKRKNSD